MGFILKVITVPTGKIISKKYSKGDLEFLSIGDYGQSANVKADFLGLTKPINRVEKTQIDPLEDKWVITISTQFGCSMGCTFCDVPKVGPGRNASKGEMLDQILTARQAYPEVLGTKRLNVHFARMGEPSFNQAVIETAVDLIGESFKEEMNLPAKTVHPVLTTMLPKKNSMLKSILYDWVWVKNYVYRGEAGLQLSINSTNDNQRDAMYRGSTTDLQSISKLVESFPKPNGRKYCLNFAMADGYELDGKTLASLFNPDHWMVKITPIHVNTATRDNGIQSTGGYDTYDFYKPFEESSKAAGFDTLVFVPSYDEDFGMITCGNVVLSGRNPEVPYTMESFS